MRKAPCEPGFSTAGPVSAATGACGPRLRRPSCRPARAQLLIPCCLVACALPTPQPADPQAHAQQLLSASAELDSTWVPAEADRWRYRQWRRQMQARNPDLQAARAQWRAVQTAEAQAGLRRNPRLALTLERVVDGPVAWLYGAALELLLQRPGVRQRQAQLAAIATLLARTEVDALAARLDTQLRLALLDIDRAMQEQALLQAREQVQAAHLASLDLRTRLGDAAASERSLLQTRLLQVGGERARSSALATDARARLAGLLGVPVAALQSLDLRWDPADDDLPEAEHEAARLHALVRHPDVQRALHAYARAELKLRDAIGQQVPAAMLAPGYEWDQGERSLTLDLGFELPLFHRNQAAVKTALAQRQAATASLLAAQAGLFNRIERAQGALRAARAAENDAERMLQLAYEAESSIERRLDAGAASRPLLLAARETRIAAELRRVRARHQRRLAGGRLQDALYATSNDDLAGPLPDSAFDSMSPPPSEALFEPVRGDDS